MTGLLVLIALGFVVAIGCYIKSKIKKKSDERVTKFPNDNSEQSAMPISSPFEVESP